MENVSHINLLLDANWKFTVSEKTYIAGIIPNEKIKPGKWFDAKVPGTIHTDLLNNHLIHDPFYSDNELKLGWIVEQDWIYRTEFNYTEATDDKITLVFEGLDTVSEIFLNNIKLGSTENMFLSYCFNISGKLKLKNNLLKIIFHSPLKYAKKQEKKFGKLPVALNSERVYIRKAQYSFGWDWGPSFPTSGIWKNVYIGKTPDAKIENFTFNTVKLKNKNALIEISASFSIRRKNDVYLSFHLFNNKHSYLKKIKINSSRTKKILFDIKEPDLWWPNGYGEQNLYSLQLKITGNDGKVIDEVNKKVGIRSVELIEKENSKATFKLRINGKDVFCKGADWIPSDSFIPRIADSKYLKQLELAKNANMNTVRVWGGGFYENDKFYGICDELGLLVWQDFMFACASYPEHKNFIENIKKEFTENIIRIRHHPSLAIWCGNNENEWLWYQHEKTSYKKMPGYKIYHSVIPSVLKKLCPYIPYWPSSPFGYEEDPNSPSSGNTHQWNIWSKWTDYNEVVNDNSLFVTEFGFQGPANKDTFEKYIPLKSRNINDRIFEHHNKQIEGHERVIKFLSNHLPLNTGWDDYLYLAQLNQGFALKTCLEYWATNGRTNGSLIWQLNDSWPVTSWALIDYNLKPKLSYYFVKNILTPQLFSFKSNDKISCEIFNKSGNEFNGMCKIIMFDTISGKVVEEYSKQINVKGNKSAFIKSFRIISRYVKEILFIGSIYTPDGKLIHRNYFLNNKWKYISLPPKSLDISVINDNELKLRLHSNTVNLFVDIYSPGIDILNRGFILLPGEQIDVEIGNTNTSQVVQDNIRCFALNDYLS